MDEIVINCQDNVVDAEDNHAQFSKKYRAFLCDMPLVATGRCEYCHQCPPVIDGKPLMYLCGKYENID